MFQKLLVFIVFSAVILTSCQKEDYADGDNNKLGFSTDTVYFDTVFSTIGSSTRRFLIRNPNKNTIQIASLKIAGGKDSPFRMNVDGVAGKEFTNIEIRGEDSIWVFTEVTVDPEASNLPFIVKDSIVFTTNGNIQDVNLIAFGQNAIYHRPPAGKSSFVLDCNEIWNNDTPHVVYGIAVIDSMCELTIEAGTQIHFHNNGALLAYYGGSLKIKGTKAEPVILQGDRLESWYENTPGQWLGVYLFPLSFENEIEWAVIKNARIGIQCDTVNTVQSSNPTLTLENSIIKNCSSIGLSGRGTNIAAYNTLIANCGEYCGSFSLGGKYNFYHCTFGSYSTSNSDKPAVALNNWYKDADQNIITRDLEEANFYNSIIYGGKANELLLSKEDAGQFNFQFTNCLIKADDSDTDTNTPEFTDCIINQSPQFLNTSESNFHLDENSNAIDEGKFSIVTNLLPLIGKDLDNIIRTSDGKPDLGVYEYQP